MKGRTWRMKSEIARGDVWAGGNERGIVAVFKIPVVQCRSREPRNTGPGNQALRERASRNQARVFGSGGWVRVL